MTLEAAFVIDGSRKMGSRLRQILLKKDTGEGPSTEPGAGPGRNCRRSVAAAVERREEKRKMARVHAGREKGRVLYKDGPILSRRIIDQGSRAGGGYTGRGGYFACCLFRPEPKLLGY